MKHMKALSLLLAGAMLAGALAGCHDSGQEAEQTAEVKYDPQEAIAPYVDNLPEIPEADKDYVIEMGYNNCDHMVAAIIGQDTGL